MPNRKPTNVLELTGSFKKNPNRRRADPKSGDIGAPPAHLADDEKNIWLEFVANSPGGVLQSSDRVALELVCCLLAEYRRDRSEFNSAKIGVLQRGLSSLGYTPVDRSRLGFGKSETVIENPWAEFANA